MYHISFRTCWFRWPAPAQRPGHSVERVQHDYGIDLLLYTYDAHGEPENDVVYIQVKATDRMSLLQDRQSIPWTVDRADLELWLHETMPVILIVYDVYENSAYWCYVQAYFEGLPEFRIDDVGASITVHLHRTQIVTENAIRMFAVFKENVVRQIQGVVHHE